jgi:cytochrome c oxidase cbb3-type subunit 2
VHLIAPRDVVPESNMPGFPWLAKNELDGAATVGKMQALRAIGVPYTDGDIAKAPAAVDGHTEMDAMIAYLQSLKFHGEVAASKGQP